ncbi:uncharacterized protein LOC123511896 [Portunus trituberculatus]|uniref:uncharacterized protein LOC123511896 n=1 Tax=Portunus trituberculatus TaxID=210409 RepID=UPI001E1CF61C|nr:uncharacterized protein LOC123511896 [Portunus trituberculatus]
MSNLVQQIHLRGSFRVTRAAFLVSRSSRSWLHHHDSVHIRHIGQLWTGQLQALQEMDSARDTSCENTSDSGPPSASHSASSGPLLPHYSWVVRRALAWSSFCPASLYS